ncbi:MAG: hypothetical protein Q4C78_00010 [Synergistaceae bacterium]|nr:hypothetical protein [Synergistaceae bacterium]
MKFREFYFANYRLLLDEAICNEPHTGHLADFEKPMSYTDTFTIQLGDEAEFKARYEEAITSPKVFEDTQRYAVHKLKDGWAVVAPAREQISCMLLESSRDCAQMSIYMPKERNFISSDSKIDKAKKILVTAYVPHFIISSMALRGTLALHASLVERDGFGVLFLGPSGMGKSTQAKLWERYLGADFIIGDRAVCRQFGSVWYGYGMPWDGTDDIQRQKFVPVRALVALEQAKENRLCRLSAVEAMQVLLRQARLPVWNEEAMQKNTEQMWSMAQDLPFYHLQNMADEECVNLVYNTLYEVKK